MIDYDNLERLYKLIQDLDNESRVIRDALRVLNSDNEFMGSNKVYELARLAYTTILENDASLINDFEYLLHEVPIMIDGGLIAIEGKDYRIHNFEDLKNYWIETR